MNTVWIHINNTSSEKKLTHTREKKGGVILFFRLFLKNDFLRHIFYTLLYLSRKKKENDDQRPRSIHGLERGARGRVGGQRETPRGTDGRRGGAGRASARR